MSKEKSIFEVLKEAEEKIRNKLFEKNKINTTDTKHENTKLNKRSALERAK
jgi:hypothetical protein